MEMRERESEKSEIMTGWNIREKEIEEMYKREPREYERNKSKYNKR